MNGLKLHPQTGKPLKTLENVRTVLDETPALRGRIELDTFHNQIVTRARLPWQYDPDKTYKFPHEWTDYDRAQLTLMVEIILGFNAPNLLDTAFTACAAQNEYHPIKNYLDGLEWDEEPRLDTLFIDYLGVKDTPYTRAVTRKAFVAAVRRIRHPGVKFDNMLILTGPQGGYKSTILRMMGGKWFSDSLRTFEGKDAMEAMRGVWILEISELEAMRRSEVTAVKAFLSKTADRYRAAYGRYVNEYLRQCVMFGTTNSNAFLSDITGGRRFWPLRTDEQLRLKDVPKDLPWSVTRYGRRLSAMIGLGRLSIWIPMSYNRKRNGSRRTTGRRTLGRPPSRNLWSAPSPRTGMNGPSSGVTSIGLEPSKVTHRPQLSAAGCVPLRYGRRPWASARRT